MGKVRFAHFLLFERNLIGAVVFKAANLMFLKFLLLEQLGILKTSLKF